MKILTKLRIALSAIIMAVALGLGALSGGDVAVKAHYHGNVMSILLLRAGPKRGQWYAGNSYRKIRHTGRVARNGN
jgi:hypothetical protein